MLSLGRGKNEKISFFSPKSGQNEKLSVPNIIKSVPLPHRGFL